MFGALLPGVVADLTCAVQGMAYSQDNMSKTPNGAFLATPDMCQSSCSLTVYCQYFTWYNDARLEFMHSKNIQSTRTWTRLFTCIFDLYMYTIKNWTACTLWTIWTNHLAGNLIPACTFRVIALLRIRMHVGFSATRPNWWPSTMPPQGLESVQAELPRLRWLQWPLPPQWSRAWRPPHQPLRRWQWAMLPSKRKSMRSWWRKSAKWPVQLDKVNLISSLFWGLPCLDYIHNRHCQNPSNQQNGMGCFLRSPVGLDLDFKPGSTKKSKDLRWILNCPGWKLGRIKNIKRQNEPETQTDNRGTGNANIILVFWYRDT